MQPNREAIEEKDDQVAQERASRQLMETADEFPEEAAAPASLREARERGPSAGKVAAVLFLFLLVCAVVVAAGILPRMKARAALSEETTRESVPAVVVVHPTRAAMTQEVVLPASLEAYTTASIYARTSGYVKRWEGEIGTHVRAGQVLAEIETPEVDQQLQQAVADLDVAKANLQLAKTTADRFQDLLKTDSVAKQDVDNAVGNFEARQAAVQAAQANVNRLQELKSFQRVTAPFDGVITARNVDVGMLIDAGSNGSSRELFHVSDTRRLRVHVSIPQAYSPAAKPGLKADLTLPEFPGDRFGSTLVRTASAIDPNSRTLLAEFEVLNPSYKLLPGSYAELHFKLPEGHPVWLIPINALLFRSEGLQVVAVNKDSRTMLMPVTLGRDSGKTVEVLTGLTGDESLVMDPPDSVIADQEVRVVKPTSSGEPGKDGKRAQQTKSGGSPS